MAIRRRAVPPDPTIVSAGSLSLAAWGAVPSVSEKLGYPLFRPGKIRVLNFGGAGPVEASDAPRWDFLDKSQCWNVVLAPEFLLLQTTRYTDFKEFFGRWKDLLEAAKVLAIPVVERLGLRYVDLVRPAPGE